MLIKHIEQQNSVVLVYLYGRRLVMPLKRLLAKTHGGQVYMNSATSEDQANVH